MKDSLEDVEDIIASTLTKTKSSQRPTKRTKSENKDG